VKRPAEISETEWASFGVQYAAQAAAAFVHLVDADKSENFVVAELEGVYFNKFYDLLKGWVVADCEYRGKVVDDLDATQITDDMVSQLADSIRKLIQIRESHGSALSEKEFWDWVNSGWREPGRES
jgi:hypothetical protein